MNNKARMMPLLCLLTIVLCAIAYASATGAVYYHDQVMTRNARQIDGKTYVPLADVARALGGHVSARGSDLEIATDEGASSTPAGGANQVSGTKGNVGDWLFNGLWRFRVTKMERTKEYHWQYYTSAGSDKPSGSNDELVVVYCTIKNGQKSADNPILATNGTSAQKTALTDNDGQSYPPVDFDVRNGSMEPGSAKNFAVIFSVPKDAQLKDMIFTLYGYGSSTQASNVRVSLAGL